MSNFVLGNAEEQRGFPIVYCSDGFCDLTGFSRRDVIGRACDCAFLYGLGTNYNEVNRLRNVFSSHEEFSTEISLYKKNGKCVIKTDSIGNTNFFIWSMYININFGWGLRLAVLSSNKCISKFNKDRECIVEFDFYLELFILRLGIVYNYFLSSVIFYMI